MNFELLWILYYNCTLDFDIIFLRTFDFASDDRYELMPVSTGP